MVVVQQTFFRPTKQARILLILNEIQRNPHVSQAKLAHRAGVSVAMANNYIKELREQSLITAEGDNNRRIEYYLTDEGAATKQQLSLSSSAEVIQLYGATKRLFNAKFRHLHREGVKRVALFGAAETGEVAWAAARGTPVEIVAVVDSDPVKQGAPFGSLTITAPETLDSMQIDAVIIASFARQAEICHLVAHLAEKGVRIETL
jgi:predicted transcriptional regulator